MDLDVKVKATLLGAVFLIVSVTYMVQYSTEGLPTILSDPLNI